MRPALLVLALAGCQPSPPAAAAPAVELVDADGAPVVRIERTPAGCTISPPGLTALVAGDVTSAGPWKVAPAVAGGRELAGASGPIARVVVEGDRTSVIDPVGVPVVRVVVEGGGATLLDPGRAPIGRLEATDDGVRVTDPARRPGLALRGATDLGLAAVLAGAPALPLEARALYACERLASLSPMKKK